MTIMIHHFNRRNTTKFEEDCLEFQFISEINGNVKGIYSQTKHFHANLEIEKNIFFILRELLK